MANYRMMLDLFGDGGGAAAGAASGAAAGTGEGGQTAGAGAPEGQGEQPQDRAAQFKALIDGEYKAEFDQLMRRNLDRRFKETEDLRKRADSASEIMDILAGKYGVDAADVEGLKKAMDSDDAYYEAEAADKGLTVAQLKEFKRMERENAQLRAAAEDRQRAERAEQVRSRWAEQIDATRHVYKGFDFEAEAQNPAFARLLRAGVDVRTAYEVAHHDEIISGAMQFTAQKVQQKTVNDIRARGLRPDEGGLNAQQAAAQSHTDVSKLTREQRNEMARRALRGERITFNEGS